MTDDHRATEDRISAALAQITVDDQAIGITMARHHLSPRPARDHLLHLAEVVDVPFSVATTMIVHTQRR
ncbi:hypothetical protein ACQ7HM_07485 [Williamsia sp. MIQD14]|uniref:hypothetical protein n=1 Tax=Williamsia sp. MIQD14 TaxID=3425703 RepID=UPI003DA1AEAB